jgi:hypothetical protein
MVTETPAAAVVEQQRRQQRQQQPPPASTASEHKSQRQQNLVAFFLSFPRRTLRCDACVGVQNAGVAKPSAAH